MSVKSICLGALVAAVLVPGMTRAQTASSPTVGGVMSGVATNPADPGVIISDGPRLPGNVPAYSGPRSLMGPEGENAPPPPGQNTLSSWILYPRSPGCCGPTCNFGPIAAELFFNVGPSFNVGGGLF